MARKRDQIDLLLESWATRRRELVGIRHPLTAAEYLGAVRCTLGARRDLHHGGKSGRIEQHFPEFPYQGDLYVVNMAVKRMPPTLAEIIDWHWTLDRPRDKRLRADLMRDTFATGIELPPFERGDLVAILDAGAYGSVMSSRYYGRGALAQVVHEGGRLLLAAPAEPPLAATALAAPTPL